MALGGAADGAGAEPGFRAGVNGSGLGQRLKARPHREGGVPRGRGTPSLVGHESGAGEAQCRAGDMAPIDEVGMIARGKTQPRALSLHSVVLIAADAAVALGVVISCW